MAGGAYLSTGVVFVNSRWCLPFCWCSVCDDRWCLPFCWCSVCDDAYLSAGVVFVMGGGAYLSAGVVFVMIGGAYLSAGVVFVMGSGTYLSAGVMFVVGKFLVHGLEEHLVCDFPHVHTRLVEDGKHALVRGLHQVTDDLVVEVINLKCNKYKVLHLLHIWIVTNLSYSILP